MLSFKIDFIDVPTLSDIVLKMKMKDDDTW